MVFFEMANSLLKDCKRTLRDIRIVPLLGVRGIFVIEQNPDGRCVRVVMLSRSIGPKERAQKKQGNQHTATNQKKDNAHFL